ncbi:MAG: flavodoxin [Frankiales bacterium]|nr:flavodoxin [Frankiales bacterium]
MNVLIVYESMFGNTRRIAEAIAAGLTPSDVELVDVSHAPAAIGQEVDLLVVGGPTHAFSLSRASTRQDAVREAGQPPVSGDAGLREWLEALPVPTRTDGLAGATFDTRVTRPRLPGSAAKAAQRRLRHLGLQIIAPAQSFWVRGKAGPLVDGEQERALAWGAELTSRAGIPQ